MRIHTKGRSKPHAYKHKVEPSHINLINSYIPDFTTPHHHNLILHKIHSQAIHGAIASHGTVSNKTHHKYKHRASIKIKQHPLQSIAK